MSVVVDAFDVVIRSAALSDVAAFRHAVPNATFCTDGRLVRASFMRSEDREAFIARLALPMHDVARVDPRTAPSVEWLEMGRYAGGLGVWLRGTAPEPLVVPLRWSPGRLTFHSEEDAKQHLEYLGIENNVEVYRDKRTGQKLYAGRTTPQLDPAHAAQLDATLKRANDLVRAHILGPPKQLGALDERNVKEGAALFQWVIQAAPHAWSAMWTLGMALRALREHEQALECFRRAYALNPGARDVGREYAGQCAIVGETAEGLHISRELHARFPDDVGLQSNLALALLIGGDLDEALAVAQAASRRDPNDPITRNLVGYIQAVKSGRKPRPTRLPGY